MPEGSIFVVFLFLFSIFLVLALMLWLSWSREEVRGSRSPYTGGKLRLGMDLAHSMQEYVNVFLKEEQQPGNPPIDFSRAAVCNETGRIFSDCVSSSGHIDLSWSFLQKKCQGTYVSWGALPETERAVLQLLHPSLEGFQTKESCLRIRPEDVEHEYALLSPGPLYIDRKTKVLVGWKMVPGTSLEVFVLQRPKYVSIDETL